MKAIERIKKLIKRYRHAWVLLYGLIYIPWFIYLERRTNVHHFLIHSPVDDYIPFVEYFIVPYLLWFAFVAVAAGYFFFTDTKGFYRLSAFLIAGMTFFLFLCTVFPNGLNLRPTSFVRDNIFVDLVR
ncbi:MAG: phosphoesterase, partial [Lachnospiraceae bacterium]|nr:phosphoesterase [Lachnospiraceae bacterium]